MMREPIAIVQTASDIAKLTHRWELACGAEERAGKSLAQSRLDKGRILVEARDQFATRGPKAKAWGDLLAKWGIEERTARNYMALAGYVDEKVSESLSETPTYEKAGITRGAKPRESLDASVEVSESDEDSTPEDGDEFASNSAADPQSYLAAYLIRADQAARFAIFKGSASKDVVAMARLVAAAWSRLADQMEKAL